MFFHRNERHEAVPQILTAIVASPAVLPRIAAALLLIAFASVDSTESGPPMPDPELAWEHRDLRAVEVWLVDAIDDSVEALRARAWLARRGGDSERALELIARAIERAPDSADLRVDFASFRSDLLDDAGPFRSLRIARDVRDNLEHAVSVAPDHVDALVALATFHQRAPAIAGGNGHFADTLMTRLEHLAPGRMRLREAMQLAEEKRFDEAVHRMSQAIELSVQVRPKWFLRKGLWLLELGQFDQAALCFERALDRAPRFGPALYEFGRLAARGHADPDRGARALRHFLQLPRWPDDPAHALAWLQLGIIQEGLGAEAEALKAFELALELDPGLDEAKQALDRLSTS